MYLHYDCLPCLPGTNKLTISVGTDQIQDIRCKVHGKDVVLIDTPGFNDTDQENRSDTAILESVMDFMKESWDNKMLLSGIIYLHPLTDARMTGSSIRNLDMFRKLCGDDKLGNVILATTKWDDTPLADATRRQAELESPSGFWSLYIAGGSKVRRFMNTEASALALVGEILGLGRFVPRIQQESVLGKTVRDTDAGAYLNQRLEKLRREHQKETAALRSEIAKARSDRKCHELDGR